MDPAPFGAQGERGIRHSYFIYLYSIPPRGAQVKGQFCVCPLFLRAGRMRRKAAARGISLRGGICGVLYGALTF